MNEVCGNYHAVSQDKRAERHPRRLEGQDQYSAAQKGQVAINQGGQVRNQAAFVAKSLFLQLVYHAIAQDCHCRFRTPPLHRR
jgi:hypothetical protein